MTAMESRCRLVANGATELLSNPPLVTRLPAGMQDVLGIGDTTGDAELVTAMDELIRLELTAEDETT